MRTKSILLKCVVFLVLTIVSLGDSGRTSSKYKVSDVKISYQDTKSRNIGDLNKYVHQSNGLRNVDKKNISKENPKRLLREVKHNSLNKIMSGNVTNGVTNARKAKGFFGHGGIFSLGKVLNFFPVGGERECQPSSYTVARAGICLNPYDCRQRDGKAAGDCAHGLGVCCVFEVTCGGIIQNNLTYFMSPGFPELTATPRDCTVTIEKAFAGIMQLRIDFVHFTIGQPNRMTGECDEDAMILGEGKNNFTVCGQNHGQHIYYTLPTSSERREADELPSIKGTRLSIRSRGPDMPRLWLLRLAQMPLANSAPHGCLQYYTTDNGTIKTFNYASNGRYLASQEYKSCIRKNLGQCAVRYTPCDNKSFRIGNGGVDVYNAVESGPGYLGGAGTGFYGPDGSFIPAQQIIYVQAATPQAITTVAMDEQIVQPQNGTDTDTQGTMMDEVVQDQEDEMEGSGMDPQIMSMDPQMSAAQTSPSKSFLSVIWSYIWPSWLWGQARTLRWSPYLQYYKQDHEDDDFRYQGYGNFGFGQYGFGRQRCRDRITIPCENEYFISSVSYGPGVCDPHHCGSSFCPGESPPRCRVETSITPFAISVHFGPPTFKRNPEENIGACLKFQQLPCES